MNFSAELRQAVDPIWEAQHTHPFLRALADGSLAPASFEAWLRQDYLHRLDFARVLALAAARAPDADALRWMLGMANGVFHHELLLHHAYGIELGITEEELAAGAKRPATQAYADHLLRVAGLGSFVELVAALLPCVAGHAEIAAGMVSGMAQKPPSPRYSRWIESRCSPGLQRFSAETARRLDRLAETAAPAERLRALEAYRLSCRYEWMCWQQCLDERAWPI